MHAEHLAELACPQPHAPPAATPPAQGELQVELLPGNTLHPQRLPLRHLSILCIPPRGAVVGAGSCCAAAAAVATPSVAAPAGAAAPSRGAPAQRGHLWRRRLQQAAAVWRDAQQAGQREAAGIGSGGAGGAALLQPRPQQQAALRGGRTNRVGGLK